MNASFDGTPVCLRLESDHLVLIDPLALDGLSEKLAEIGGASTSDQLVQLRMLGDRGLRIGVEAVGLQPGSYEVGLDAFAAADPADTHAGVFDVDSGAVVLIDLMALADVARALTWDRYDALLRAPVADTPVLTDINREVGGPRFAIVSADATSSFTGDGSFRLRPGTLIPSSER